MADHLNFQSRPSSAQTSLGGDGTSPGVKSGSSGAGADNSTIVTLPWPPRIVHQNGRSGWAKKAAMTKAYRRACADAAWNAGITPMEVYAVESITFCPPDSRKRDLDGMIGSFKAGQDGLADAMGADDNAFRPTYHVSEPAPGGAVRVRLIEIPIPG